MDRTNPAVAAFTSANLAAMDDDTLAALANKGLVRRARKDMEKAQPAVVDADGQNAVLLDVESNRVRLTTPIGKSTCGCGSGVCRHILAAIIYLRENTLAEPPAQPSSSAESSDAGVAAQDAPSSQAPPVDSAAVLLALDEETINRWAGKALFKKAAVALARGVEIDQQIPVTIRLPAQNVAVRFMAGGLDGMLCTCHAPAACEHKVAALLAYRAAKSGQPLVLGQAALTASTGAPRTREEVLESVQNALNEMFSLGTSRLSISTEQRLRTLAVSAHGVELPRLERSLKSLSDDVSLMLKREARASSLSILNQASRTAALVAALQHPTPALVGEHRSTYLPVSGTIELVGLGAARWRTRSGYHGLTLYFWEPAVRRWTAWSDARPVDAPGFDPLQRFGEDGPWTGATGLRQAAATRWRVSGAFRNGAGRIAARSGTRGVPGGKAAATDGPAIADFADLDTVAAAAFASGLNEPRDHTNLVLLAPAAWSEAYYDPITQKVSRAVCDADGRCIELVLRHSPETQQALTTLQSLPSQSLRHVLGFLHLGPGGLYLEPITLWTDDRSIHLTLESPISSASGASKKTAPATPVTSIPSITTGEDGLAVDDEEAAVEPEGLPEIEHGETSVLSRVLTKIDDELLAIAEGGTKLFRDLAALRASARELQSAGMTTASASVDRLCEALDRVRKSTLRDEQGAAESLLKCSYVIRLAMDCDTLTAATSKPVA